MNYNFKEMNLHTWIETRNLIQLYAQLLSSIKGKNYPHNKHWEEYALKIYAKGFTTGTIPVTVKNEIETLDLNLNFNEHKLKIFLGKERLSVDLDNQTITSFSKEVSYLLNKHGMKFKIEDEKFYNSSVITYDKSSVENYWHNLKQIYFIFLKIKNELLAETSDINFWSHHFDLAFLTFNGKLIPDHDMNKFDHSREQFNFGFASGDEGINEPYFYLTLYPNNNVLEKIILPDGAYLHTEGWTGIVIKYSEFQKQNDPETYITGIFNSVLKNFIN